MSGGELDGKVALITGGTRGLGHAIGLALAGQGARVVVTHRWGSVDEDELAGAYTDMDRALPLVLEADVGDADDVRRVIGTIAERYGRLDIFVSNVCVAARGTGFDGLRKRDLLLSLDRSAWPLLSHLDAIESRFGRLPRTTIAMSSDGPGHFYPGYDYVAASKAALESLVVSQAGRVAASGGRIFGLSTRQVDTQSLGEIFGADLAATLLRDFTFFATAAGEMGEAAAVLASGLLDGLHGQVVHVDKGAGFFDNFISVAPLALSGAIPS
jgi:NAD(P)-dependent dehydrogenase (short-subunit alcohol dehydrogenase family)